MANAAATTKYKEYQEEFLPLFKTENLSKKEQLQLSGTYNISIEKYSAKIGKYNRRGSRSFFFKGEEFIKEWYCIDDDAQFYSLIIHKNGREYLVFRQDLYGYSVLDIEKRSIMQFFPEYSLDMGETFIWTDIHYNQANNILAVEGCYWAWPYSVQLFDFTDPMSQTPVFVDIISCLDGDYDVYEELEFVAWEEDTLKLKAFLVESEEKIELMIDGDKYMAWLSDRALAKHL